MEGSSAPKETRLTSECMTQTMTNFCYLDTNIRLSINFNDVKVWTNLKYINLSNNMITNLPRALGDLPRLQELNLSHNCLGYYNKIKWTWIRQTAIKNTLLFLDISYNLLTELLSHIGKLNALVELNVCHNMLKCLPQTILNMQSIKILNVSYNRLLYLPGKTFPVNLERTNISMNPFPVQQTRSVNFVEMSVIPTLVELSAKTVLHNRIPYEGLIPDELVEYLDMTKYCNFCQRTGIKLLILYLKHYFSFRYGDILITPHKPWIIQYYFCNRCREYIPECEVSIPEF